MMKICLLVICELGGLSLTDSGKRDLPLFLAWSWRKFNVSERVGGSGNAYNVAHKSDELYCNVTDPNFTQRASLHTVMLLPGLQVGLSQPDLAP